MSDDDDVLDENDARLFCYGVGSHCFVRLVGWLRDELAEADPAQAAALELVVSRMRLMRDVLEERLRTATGPPVIPGEAVEVEPRSEP